MTRFLSYAVRENSKTGQTASRKEHVLLSESFLREKSGISERQSAPSCLNYGIWGCWELGDVPRLSIWLLVLACFPCHQKERRWQGHLSCLLALGCFLCWSLTLEIKTGRGPSKGLRKNFRAVSWRESSLS